jgi:hypothetical protein
MSSIDDEAALERTNGTPLAAAPRAAPISASSCAIERTPTGPRKNGAAERVSSTSTDTSRSVFPASIRGRKRRRSKASRFERIVASPPAPPAI